LSARASKPKRDHGLRPQVQDFAITYLANGFQAGAAYRATHPNCKSLHAARVGGSKLLATPEVKAYLAKRLEDAWRSKHISGDQALALVAGDATLDPRLMFDEDGKPLHPKDWPDEIASSVESIKLKDDGSFEVRFASKTAARRTLLEVTGKVKGISLLTLEDVLDASRGDAK
jgi:hypothetical protein